MRVLFLLVVSVGVIGSQKICAQSDPESHYYYRQCDTVFKDFIAAARTITQRHTADGSPIDTADVQLLLRNHFTYFDVNREIQVEKQNEIAVRSIEQFISYFKYDTSALHMRRLDAVKDKMLYDSFDAFTRVQSFAVIRSDSGEPPLFYLLILNGPLLNKTSPQIISWKVVYVAGRFLFENILHQPGTYQLFNIHNH